MDDFKVRCCKLCLTIIEDEQYKVIEEDIKNIFVILSLKLDLCGESQHVICNVCSAKLLAALKFKMTCLNTHNVVNLYTDCMTVLPLDLREIYMKETKRHVLDDVNICRLCMLPIENVFEFKINENQVDMLQKFVPEMNIFIIKEPVMCELCLESLTVHSKFLKKCSDVEQKISNGPILDAPSHISVDISVKTEDVDGKFEDVPQIINTECEEVKSKSTFKIIQTTDKSKQTLAIVPSAWERSGELLWPRYNADILVKKPESLPDDSWFKMKCKLRRNNLLSYDAANQALQRISEKDDAEYDTEKSQRKRARVMLPRQSTGDDLNVLTNTCMNSETNNFANPATETEQLLLSNNKIQVELASKVNTLTCLLAGASKPTELQLNDKLTSILNNQNTIIENQNKILTKIENLATASNQSKIIQQLARFETMFGVLAGNLTTTNTVSHSAVEPIRDTAFDIIDTLEDIQKLEERLSDKSEMDIFVNNFSYICGRKGRGNGLNNCYMLVDRIFTRKFMTLCSWAGGARNSGEKIPFKIFKNVIYLFFKIIQFSDEEFSLKDCENFFKSVLRNSTKRSESSMTRISTTKRRPSKLLYNCKANTDKGIYMERIIEYEDLGDKVKVEEENFVQ